MHYTFWMATCLTRYFIVIFFYVEWKWLLMRNLTHNLSHNLAFEVELVWKISTLQCYTWEVTKCWKIIEFTKISIKMKNCKTFYEAQTASHLQEIIHPPRSPVPPGKSLLRFWNKNVHTEIYKNIQTFALKVLRECISCASRNGTVQMFFFFWHQPDVCRNICEVRKVFGCVAEAYFFQCRVSWSP